MDYKIKSSLLLGAVFILGSVVGYLIRDMVTKSPYEQVRLLRTKGGIVHRFEDVLNLTEEQKMQLKPILENHEKKIMNAAEKSRQEISKIMESFKIELQPYLDDEQIKLLTDESNFSPPPPGPRGIANFLKDRLNLTDVQFEKVKEIYLGEEEKLKLLRPEFPDATRDKTHEQIQKIAGETKNEILKILNEEQKEEFKKIEGERGKGTGIIIRMREGIPIK